MAQKRLRSGSPTTSNKNVGQISGSKVKERNLETFFDDSCLALSDLIRHHLAHRSNELVSFSLSGSDAKRSLVSTGNGKHTSVVSKSQVFPSLEQRKTLNMWLGPARFVCNKIVAHVREYGVRTKKGHKFWLQNGFLEKKTIPLKQSWMWKTRSDIRKGAIFDFVEAREGRDHKYQTPEHPVFLNAIPIEITAVTEHSYF